MEVGIRRLISLSTLPNRGFWQDDYESMACGTPVVATVLVDSEQVIPVKLAICLLQKTLRPGTESPCLLALPDSAFQARQQMHLLCHAIFLGNQLKHLTDWYHTLVQH